MDDFENNVIGTGTGTGTGTSTSTSTNPKIKNIIEQIMRLNETDDKNEFIDGYKTVGEQIGIVDKILDGDEDEFMENFLNMETNQLFEKLCELMEMGDGIRVRELKKSKKIMEILDERLALGHTIDVIE